MIEIFDKTMDEKMNAYENVIEFITYENNFYYNLIFEIQKNEKCIYNDEIQNYYDIIKLNHNFFVRMNEKYKNNEIKYIIRFDDYFIVYLNDNIIHSYMIYDDIDENNNECFTTLFECDNIEKYDNFDEFLKLNDLHYIYDDVLNMYVNETKIFDCVCDNALLKINDIEFNIIVDDVEYEMLIEKNNCFYVVDVNFNDCEFINNYATKIKLTRIK